MRMHNGIDIFADGRVDIAVKAPFGGGQYSAFMLAVHMHQDNLFGPGFFIGDASGGNQEAPIPAFPRD